MGNGTLELIVNAHVIKGIQCTKQARLFSFG